MKKAKSIGRDTGLLLYPCRCGSGSPGYALCLFLFEIFILGSVLLQTVSKCCTAAAPERSEHSLVTALKAWQCAGEGDPSPDRAIRCCADPPLERNMSLGQVVERQTDNS